MAITNVHDIKTMDEFFTTYANNSKLFTVPKLKIGKSKTIKEFYDNVIEPNLPKKEVVLAWDKVLREYIKHDDKIIFIRRYASGEFPKTKEEKQKDREMLAKDPDYKIPHHYDIRRGFLTQLTDGFRYVFVDNYFPQIICFMVLNDFVPTEKDFRQYINDFKMPYGFRVDNEREINYQVFHTCKDVRFNNSGWKHSHLFPANCKVGEMYYKNFDYAREIDTLAPKGVYEDWEKDEKKGFDYNIRIMDPPKIDNYKNKLIAHFLRVCHPLNYILTPGTTHHITPLCKDIGEYPELLQYTYLKLKEMYGNVLTDFKDIVYGIMDENVSLEDLGNIEIDCEYGSSYSNKKNNSSDNFTVKERSESLYEYLFNNLGLEDIERKVLHLDNKIGFSATKIRNDMGLTSSDKNKFSNKDVFALTKNDCDSEDLWKTIKFIQKNLDKDYPKNNLPKSKASPIPSSSSSSSQKESTLRSLLAKVSDQDKAKGLYAFVFKGLGLKTIDKDVLKNNGIGFTATAIRDDMKLPKDSRGILSKKDLYSLTENECSNKAIWDAVLFIRKYLTNADLLSINNL